MADVKLSTQLQVLLESQSSDLTLLSEFRSLVDAKVLELSTSENPEPLLYQFEEDLQNLYNETVDHASLYHSEVFIDVLYRLKPVLSSSLILTWFDLLLRPALREPKLASPVVDQAKQLVITAMETSKDSQEKVGEFQRRIMDLYLLDALNEGSGDDILEWSALDEDSREKRTLWKTNLEDILIRFGLIRPTELMTIMYNCFASPTCRLQILILLDSFISQSPFIDIAPTVTCHPILSSLLLSLQLDNSSTVCTFGVSALMKLLPIMAVRAYGDLKRLLPQLLVILGRMIYWKARKRPREATSVSYSDLMDQQDLSLVADLERSEHEEEIAKDIAVDRRKLELREGLSWECLEHSFDSTASSPPSPRQYFSFLYYLFPCNTIDFLRRPASYLAEIGTESPYTVGWEEALDEAQIRTETGQLLRNYVVHSSIIWQDARIELELLDPWASYDVPRIIGECVMLEVGYAAFGLDENTPVRPQPAISVGEGMQTPTANAAKLPRTHAKHQISLQDMIATSVALKAGLDVDIIDPIPLWPSMLFTAGAGAAEEGSPFSAMDASAPPRVKEANEPSHVTETISSLQREVLLLRNELNFELWLKRENVRHIGRLHQDRVTTKTAELERQGLHNKLREYKGQLMHLEKELKKHHGQALDMKQKYSEWNAQLQSKLNDLRDQKKAWMTEATELRRGNVEAKAHLAAQGRLLADAVNKVFLLESQIKEDAHKVQRLRDYEKRIDQLTTMHRMWNEDVRLYNEQSKEISVLMSDYQKMKLRLESYEKTHIEMEEADRAYRRRIQSLEATLRTRRQDSEGARHNPVHAIAAYSTERTALAKANQTLRVENEELRDEVEEMKAMVEVLKAQLTGTKGLVDPVPALAF